MRKIVKLVSERSHRTPYISFKDIWHAHPVFSASNAFKRPDYVVKLVVVSSSQFFQQCRSTFMKGHFREICNIRICPYISTHLVSVRITKSCFHLIFWQKLQVNASSVEI